MTLIEHLRGWDEMPEDDSEAFRWLDLKTAEAADELEFLQQQLVDARRTAEYWKANHLAGNQQLAAAIAACKLKDESIEAAHNGLRWWMDTFPLHVTEADNEEMLKIVKALAIQPDDYALKAWLGEPVAWADTYGNVIRNSTKEFSQNVMTNAFSVPIYSPKLLK